MIVEEVAMACEKCGDVDVRAQRGAVALAAMMAAVVGIGTCAKRRRHRRARDDAHEGDGHEHERDHGHGHEHATGGPGRHDEHEHGDWRLGRRAYGPLKRGLDPLHILERRFASGEIDEDEYRRRRRVLLDDVD